MFGWKKRQEEIEVLKKEIKELREQYWELKRIVQYANQKDAFRIGYELSEEFPGRLIPVLYLYRDYEEYKIRFTRCADLMFTNGKVRYENDLAYFDTDVYMGYGKEKKPVGTYHYVIDYVADSYVCSVESTVEVTK